MWKTKPHSRQDDELRESWNEELTGTGHPVGWKLETKAAAAPVWAKGVFTDLLALVQTLHTLVQIYKPHTRSFINAETHSMSGAE